MSVVDSAIVFSGAKHTTKYVGGTAQYNIKTILLSEEYHKTVYRKSVGFCYTQANRYRMCNNGFIFIAKLLL
jgi:hypothetical protein